MRRLAILAICLGAFVLNLGCDSGGGSKDSTTLESGKVPPPKRQGVPSKK
jgi:hypothetical protein